MKNRVKQISLWTLGVAIGLPALAFICLAVAGLVAGTIETAQEVGTKQVITNLIDHKPAPSSLAKE